MVDVAANLVMNAVEAADGAPVRISMRCAAEGRDRVRFEVEDDGRRVRGFRPVEAVPPFVTTKEAGTGLGLAWCQKIVEEHGGSLTIHRVAPRGALLRITLPRTRER
jgi:nitrogen fixation/metabolism regulation signal transduction histidine kinase